MDGDLGDRNRILEEVAAQIEAELEHGITFWAEGAWNDAARAFLAPPPEPASAAALSRAAKRPEPRAPAKPGPTRLATPATPATPGTSSGRSPAGAKKSFPTFGPPPAADDRDPDWERALDVVRQEAKGCVRCPLHKTRTNVVFDSGSGRVPLVFAGEAPGADEDAQGEAFVGRAGQLLTKIIAAIGLDRNDVYICNVLKCRPPGNRNPAPIEIQTCSPYLERQLEILKPRVICTLGLFATQLLLDTTAPIGKLRGRVFRYRDIPLVPTYHPAALLRNPNLKRNVWEDVQLVRRILDEGVKAPEGTVPGHKERKPESGRLL